MPRVLATFAFSLAPLGVNKTDKTMKNSFILIIVLLFAASGCAQTVSPAQAKDYVDKKVTVCGLVSDVYVSTKGQAPTFLHFGGKHPNELFSVVVYKDDLAKFTNPLGGLANKNVCVTGYIKLYKGKPEMTVNSPSQIVAK